MTTAISVRLPEGLEKALEAITRETERSKTFVIKEALEAYFEEYADYQMALDRLTDKNDRIISSKELRKDLGL